MQKIKLILFGQTITATLYAIVYLLKSFVIWKFTNPFLWLINLGRYNEELRFHFLIGFVTYYFVLYAVIFENKNKIINLLTLKK